jgi:hypothetical protein
LHPHLLLRLMLQHVMRLRIRMLHLLLCFWWPLKMRVPRILFMAQLMWLVAQIVLVLLLRRYLLLPKLMLRYRHHR